MISRDALGLERLADQLAAIDGDVRVVDERLLAVDHGVGGDSERERALVDPVVAVLRVADAVAAAFVEGETFAAGLRMRTAASSRRRRREWVPQALPDDQIPH